jgi:hypothetical protein
MQPIGQVPTRLVSLLEHALEPRHIELHKHAKCGPFCGVEWALEWPLKVCHYLVVRRLWGGGFPLGHKHLLRLKGGVRGPRGTLCHQTCATTDGDWRRRATSSTSGGALRMGVFSGAETCLANTLARVEGEVDIEVGGRSPSTLGALASAKLSWTIRGGERLSATNVWTSIEAAVRVDGHPRAEAPTDRLTTSEATSSSSIGLTQMGGPAPSYSATTSGLDSWE